MSLVQIRKLVVSVETVLHDGGAVIDPPLLVGTAAAVVRNPYAGHHEGNLLPMMADLKSLGRRRSSRHRSIRQGRHRRGER